MSDTSRWYNAIVRPFQRLAALCRPQGASPTRPYTYVLASWAFLRLLGLVYVMAFGSLWLQLDGLIGREGIVPVAPLLAAAQPRLRATISGAGSPPMSLVIAGSERFSGA